MATKAKKENKKEDALKEELESIKEKLKEKEDANLRLMAEFENYKKRTAKERLELLDTAEKDVILSLLPVIDDFDRAMKQFEDSHKDSPLFEGVKLIFHKFNNLLAQKNVKAMESIGKDFDPEFHEAVTEIPAPSKDLVNKVVDEIEKGYFINDKIIRFAKVVVGK